ncbi:acetylglutamate kinase [Mesobacillus zeae]|uniref:Acetylglutamate kinase n=2 Tax=Mesobacillus zeae TaxID=1917180 RepID=A0A398BFS9_9BACI|nr:acetylglutamate kinase [Mesobacillus zeae]
MRFLWEQHIAWTRFAILSLVFNLPDAEFVIARLLRNATDMGNFMARFYGKQVGAHYESLIKAHLVIAADLVKAAKKGDQTAAASIERKWYENADEIAAFISKVNPYISENEFRNMFYEHLAFVKAQAVFMLQKDYQSGVAVYDKYETQALHMADAITRAIVKQFPNAFPPGKRSY